MHIFHWFCLNQIFFSFEEEERKNVWQMQVFVVVVVVIVECLLCKWSPQNWIISIDGRAQNVFLKRRFATRHFDERRFEAMRIVQVDCAKHKHLIGDTRICWQLIAPPSTPDFLGNGGLYFALCMVTSCCSSQTARWRPSDCWLWWGSMSLGNPSKSH